MLKKQIKSKLKRYIVWFIIAFIVVFVLRFFYALYDDRHYIFVNYNISTSNYYDQAYAPALTSVSSVKNVASAKISQRDVYTGQNITIDQKYEKVANLTASSSSFNDDNKKLRQIIKDNNAVVQAENLEGLSGRQTLTMAIGVMPDNFDDLVEAVKAIGNLRSFSVNKVDKTDEFRRLMAEQETLLKSREAYETIKAKGGDIRDLLMLEDKILDIEAKMQNMGVNLGTYSSENSFCTINFALSTEVAGSAAHISKRALFQCFVSSFIWTVIFFVIAAAVITFFTICFLIVMLVVQKIQKILPKETESPALVKTDDKLNNTAA